MHHYSTLCMGKLRCDNVTRLLYVTPQTSSKAGKAPLVSWVLTLCWMGWQCCDPLLPSTACSLPPSRANHRKQPNAQRSLQPRSVFLHSELAFSLIRGVLPSQHEKFTPWGTD